MSEVQLALANTAGIASVVCFWVFSFAGAVRKWQSFLMRTAFLLMRFAFFALTACVVFRGIDAARFPVSNLYESLLLFAWAIMGAYLWLSHHYEIKHIGWLVSLASVLFFLYGSWLPAEQHVVKPLAPALVSYWRQIHVPPLIVSYALFLIAGIASFAQLWCSRRFHSVAFLAIGGLAGIVAIVLGTFTDANTHALQLLFVGGGLIGLSFGCLSLKSGGSSKVEAAQLYALLTERSITVGVPLLTIGIVTGALWANHAWGSYWSWDPKESMSLVTWLCYSGYIHLRLNRRTSRELLSVVAIGGMLLTLLTYLGFNALGFGGMHSYGSVR